MRPIVPGGHCVYSEDYRKYDVIPLFISVAQAAAKEKIVRVNIATLRVSFFQYLIATSYSCFDALKNLVSKAPSANLPAMLVAELLPFVKNLAARKWSDEDILEDVNFLRDELEARFESLTCVPYLP
jgi:V-type H+-transporting ATPase subunit H